jgi:hypothetical protein
VDIRRIEEKQLKIGPQDAIHIDTVYGATTRR